MELKYKLIIKIFCYRSGDSADGVDQSVAADSDAGARAARSRGATDRRRERYVAPRHPVALSTSQFATAAKPTALCKYLLYCFDSFSISENVPTRFTRTQIEWISPNACV